MNEYEQKIINVIREFIHFKPKLAHVEFLDNSVVMTFIYYLSVSSEFIDNPPFAKPPYYRDFLIQMPIPFAEENRYPINNEFINNVLGYEVIP